eukprot:3251773-Rhodomonas_salina.1
MAHAQSRKTDPQAECFKVVLRYPGTLPGVRRPGEATRLYPGTRVPRISRSCQAVSRVRLVAASVTGVQVVLRRGHAAGWYRLSLSFSLNLNQPHWQAASASRPWGNLILKPASALPARRSVRLTASDSEPAASSHGFFNGFYEWTEPKTGRDGPSDSAAASTGTGGCESDSARGEGSPASSLVDKGADEAAERVVRDQLHRLHPAQTAAEIEAEMEAQIRVEMEMEMETETEQARHAERRTRPVSG